MGEVAGIRPDRGLALAARADRGLEALATGQAPARCRNRREAAEEIIGGHDPDLAPHGLAFPIGGLLGNEGRRRIGPPPAGWSQSQLGLVMYFCMSGLSTLARVKTTLSTWMVFSA